MQNCQDTFSATFTSYNELFGYSTYLWDPRYKGLDDYIWESLLHKQRAN